MEQLLLWLRHIKGDTNASLAVLFGGIDVTTVSRYVDHVTACVNSELDHMIEWPSAEERRRLQGVWEAYPMAVAVLDGTHCKVDKPANDPDPLYSGYKCAHTYNYLCCVDFMGVILSVEGPFDGRPNDRSVWNQSHLGQHSAEYLSEDERILADGGFVGGGVLITPIHQTVIDSVEEADREVLRRVNRRFTSCRIIVEDVFEWLKARAHILNEVYHHSLAKQGPLFLAACRLHNFVRINRIDHAITLPPI